MLHVKELHYRYPGAPKAALSAISLETRRGQILGLLGLNGAGKSTLVAHLAGLLDIQQGEILIDGQPLQQYRRNHPTGIAVAPQDYAFYPVLTVRENLECFAGFNRLKARAAQQAVTRALALTQLEDQADTRAGQLSGGLKRRLNLAIALLAQPELIVLDEPTAGVDSQSRAFLLETVKQLATGGAAVIYTSHYLGEIEAIADQVAILHGGQMLRHGPLGSLLAEGAAHLSVLFASAATPDLVAALQSIGTPELDGRELRVQLAPGVSPVAALQLVEKVSPPILEIHAGCHTLEQLFMRLTREKPEFDS